MRGCELVGKNIKRIRVAKCSWFATGPQEANLNHSCDHARQLRRKPATAILAQNEIGGAKRMIPHELQDRRVDR